MSYPSNQWPQPPVQDTPNPKPALVSPMAIATELWLVVIAGQAVAYGGQYSSAADQVRDAAREASAADADMMTSTSFLVSVFVGVGVVVTAVSLLLVWLARSGHNWARLVLSFLSAFLVVQAVFALFGDAGPAWTTIPAVISGVAALGAAYLLMQKDSEKYCRAMAVYRRGGPTPEPPPGHYPPNQHQPNLYPPNQQQSGQYPPNQYPPVQYPPASYPQQQYPPAQQQYYDPHAYDPRTFDPQAYAQPSGTPPVDESALARPASGQNVRERDLSAPPTGAETPSDPDNTGGSENAAGSHDTEDEKR